MAADATGSDPPEGDPKSMGVRPPFDAKEPKSAGPRRAAQGAYRGRLDGGGFVVAVVAGFRTILGP